MAKCDEGYLCSICGADVESVTDSELYLRYVIGLLDPELLHVTPEKHIRCNPSLAQFIVAKDFEPVVVAMLQLIGEQAIVRSASRQPVCQARHTFGL